MFRTLTILVVAATTLAAAVDGATLKTRTIGRASASGDFAVTIASGTAKKPRSILIRITARPRQRVTGNWTVVCSKGFGAGSKSGRFAGRTPITRQMRLPMSRPDTCTASGGGQLRRSGRITVVLLAVT